MKNSLYSIIGFIVLPFIWEANFTTLSALAEKEVVLTSKELFLALQADTSATKLQIRTPAKVDGTIVLKNLEADFDGTPKAASINTIPAGLKTLSVYVKDGIIYQEPPVEKGVYELIVVINDLTSEATTISERFTIK